MRRPCGAEGRRSVRVCEASAENEICARFLPVCESQCRRGGGRAAGAGQERAAAFVPVPRAEHPAERGAFLSVRAAVCLQLIAV